MGTLQSDGWGCSKKILHGDFNIAALSNQSVDIKLPGGEV
jgi:hypothetical protein